MSSRASLYVKYLRFVGRVSDWILFGILLFFALLFAFLSIYAFSALLSMALFMSPVGWFKSEFKLRFTLFILTVAFLILLFAVSGVPPAYIASEIVLASFSVILLFRKSRWVISEYIGTKDALYFAASLMVIATLFLISRQQPEQVIAISGLLATATMLNYLCIALRRSELSRILLEIGGFKTLEEFAEKAIEKADIKDDEAMGFIRYRFREFSSYVERGEFKQAYVTLATGTLELLGVWDEISKIKYGYGCCKKDGEDKCKRLKQWWMGCDKNGKDEEITHSRIRGAIVHSIPGKTGKSRSKAEDKQKDLPIRKKILDRFRVDPITPIEDLFHATVDILKMGGRQD
jgi:hypothetical protein